jgi:predicted phosphate transport protein (TIGR00153 family)
MQLHMEKANECAQTLVRFYEESQRGDWESATRSQESIRDLEEEADVLKRDIRRNLPKGLFMPVDRTDLLELLRIQDKIANTSRDICGLMLGRRIDVPDQLKSDMHSFVSAAAATSAQALQVIEELDELLETGFIGREAIRTEELIRRLEDLESEVDRLEILVRAGLFAIENDYPPVHVMFLYNLIALIGDLADRAERVGARLQMLMAR